MQKEICKKIIALRGFLLVVGLIITGFFIYQSFKIRIYDDPLKWPPKNDKNVIVNNEIQDLFGGANVVTIQLTVKEGDIFDSKVLAKVKNICDKILTMDGVIPSYLTSLSAQKVKYMKGEADLLTLEPLMEYAPETKEEMERLKYGVFHNPLLYGPIVSIDKKSTIIIADFRTGDRKPGEPTYFRTSPDDIYQDIQKIIKPEEDSNTNIKSAGSPIIIGWVNTDGLPYILFAFVGFLICLAIVIFLSLRSVRAVFLSLLLSLVGSVWAFGLFTIFFGNILLSSSGLIAPFIIMAAVVCHCVQFFRRFIEEEYLNGIAPKEAITNTVLCLFRPIVISLICDCLAFIVLAFVPFDNVSVLGRVTFLGFAGTIILMFLLIVPLLSYMPGNPKRKESKKEEERPGLIERFSNKLARRFVYEKKVQWVVLTITVILLLGSIATIPLIDIGQDNTYAIHNFITKSWRNNPIYQMEMNIKEKFKGVYTCNLMIDAKKPEGMKSIPLLRAMDNFSIELQKRCPEIAGFLHLPTYIKLMNRFMNEEKPEYFKIPDDSKAIADYVLMYTMGETGAFDSIVDPTYQKAPIGVYVDSTSHATVRKILNTVNELVPKYFGDKGVEVKFTGGNIGIAGAFNENIRKWLILATVLGAVATFLMILIVLRTVVGGLLLLLPLAIGTVIWLMIVYFMGIEMNSNTVTSMAIATGVGIDAEIYLLYRFREEFAVLKDFREALVVSFTKIRKGLIYSHFSLIIGLWMLIPIPLYIGYMGFCMGLIILICFLVSFILSPIIWSILRPRFLFEKGSTTVLSECTSGESSR